MGGALLDSPVEERDEDTIDAAGSGSWAAIMRVARALRAVAAKAAPALANLLRSTGEMPHCILRSVANVLQSVRP